jgi:pimeloyl-[acyl-carrier protein] methyl ester esterase
MHTGVWRDFAKQLGRYYQVVCVDLPGHGRSESIEPFSLERISEALINVLPIEPFNLLGWSLGATVAMDMAERFPERVKSLIVLAGNPQFVKTQDWPGVKSETLEGFAELLKSDVQQTLIRFLALQVNGLVHGKSLLQQLKKSILEAPSPSQQILQSGLDILKNTDKREFVASNVLPVNLILGDKDTLVPADSAQAVKQLNPNIHYQIMPSAGHAPFLSHTEELISKIIAMLR